MNTSSYGSRGTIVPEFDYMRALRRLQHESMSKSIIASYQRFYSATTYMHKEVRSTSESLIHTKYACSTVLLLVNITDSNVYRPYGIVYTDAIRHMLYFMSFNSGTTSDPKPLVR